MPKNANVFRLSITNQRGEFSQNDHRVAEQQEMSYEYGEDLDEIYCLELSHPRSTELDSQGTVQQQGQGLVVAGGMDVIPCWIGKTLFVAVMFDFLYYCSDRKRSMLLPRQRDTLLLSWSHSTASRPEAGQLRQRIPQYVGKSQPLVQFSCRATKKGNQISQTSTVTRWW
jgi:hypothetical protein